MNFVSDNAYGAAPEMLEALSAANAGSAAPYGEDVLTTHLEAEMARLFEREVAVFPVVTGTAANALALAAIVPQHGAVFCHTAAHVVNDECGAPEFFTQGARLVSLEGQDGKLTADRIEEAISHFQIGSVHHSQPAAVSITQASELGTCYRLEETKAVGACIRRHGMKLHMDGARFANAIAHLGCTPAEATWQAGVDVLSFGATKNGAFGAEAVVFFHQDDARDFGYRRKKSGHLLSKMRFVAAQLICALEDDRWLSWAGRANAFARRLAEGLATIADVQIAHPVEANAVFASLPDAMAARLRAQGANFYDWDRPAKGRTLVRLITSFATPEDDIERLIAFARAS